MATAHDGDVERFIETSRTMLDNVSSAKITRKGSKDVFRSATGELNGVVGANDDGSGGSGNDMESIDEQSAADNTDMKKGRSSKVVGDVMGHLEKLIMSDEWVYQAQGPTKEPTLPRRKRSSVSGPGLDELGRSVLTSYSLAAYIRLLHPQHRNALATYLYHHTTAVLTKLCRFPNSSIYFHEEKFDGLLRIIRIALQGAFPDFSQEGIKTFGGKVPVVYVSASLPYPGIERYLTFELGYVDVCIIPCPEGGDEGLTDIMDIGALEAAIEKHLGEDKVPVVVLASAGFPLTGKIDDLARLIELREKHKFWLHLDGLNLAALCLEEVPKQFEILQQADSALLPLGQWLGVPAVPFVTFHRQEELFQPSYGDKLASLPWWIVTRHLQGSGIRDRIANAYSMMLIVIKILLKQSQLAIYTDTGETINGIGQMQQFLKTPPLQLPPPVLLFRYTSKGQSLTGGIQDEEKVGSIEGSPSSDTSGSAGDTTGPPAPVTPSTNITTEYVDSVNTWLAQGLCQECPNMGIHNCATLQYGLCIRFCPLETVNALGTTEEQADAFEKQLEGSLAILNATVRARKRLPIMIKEYPSLAVADVSKWAGVGSVIYVPSMIRDSTEWNEKQRQQVSHLNIELVHELRATDTAFSVGHTNEQISCVKFGMLADDADLTHLVENVATTGQRIEESSQYIESLAQLVRQGIEAANEDLKKENEHKLVQEGVLRQVPLVGSLLNWWAPLPKENTNVHGRSFDLVSGQIQSTEAVYKQRLQIQRSASAEGPATHPTGAAATSSPSKDATEEGGDSADSSPGPLTTPNGNMTKETQREKSESDGAMADTNRAGNQTSDAPGAQAVEVVANGDKK